MAEPPEETARLPPGAPAAIWGFCSRGRGLGRAGFSGPMPDEDQTVRYSAAWPKLESRVGTLGHPPTGLAGIPSFGVLDALVGEGFYF